MKIPVAPAVLREPADPRRDPVCDWIVEECPFCGAEHRHGAGRVGQDARAFLGLRVAHCAVGPRGTYRLVSSTGALAWALVGELGAAPGVGGRASLRGARRSARPYPCRFFVAPR